MGIVLKHVAPPWETERETIIIREADSNASYGKRPEERSVSELLKLGYINLDKHVGPTSHEVTATLKRILGVDEVGHGGTLEGWLGRSGRVRRPANTPWTGY